MLMPVELDAAFHCSRIAQPSETRWISLVPTSSPRGLVTFHRPSQKSNCRNSALTHAGDREDAGVPAMAGDAARTDEAEPKATPNSTTCFIRLQVSDMK